MSLACYIHVPFCKSICPYCDFAGSYTIQNASIHGWKRFKRNRKLFTLDPKARWLAYPLSWGGTPNILSEEQLRALVEPLIPYLQKNYEFTIECNPEALNEDKIKAMKKLGVNRVSLGVQSFQDDILRKLGRRHTKEMIERAIESLKRNGIENISIDLMYALPFQDQRDLKRISKSFWNLISCIFRSIH